MFLLHLDLKIRNRLVWWMVSSFENSASPINNRSLFMKWSEQEVGGGSWGRGGGGSSTLHSGCIVL